MPMNSEASEHRYRMHADRWRIATKQVKGCSSSRLEKPRSYENYNRTERHSFRTDVQCTIPRREIIESEKELVYYGVACA